MPYVITTKRPDQRPSRIGYADDMRITSRHAVATLEEARKLAGKRARDAWGEDYWLAHGAIRIPHLITESGGTITLPDGTVIKSAPATRDDLWDALPGPKRPLWEMSDEELCAAYNEAQS